MTRDEIIAMAKEAGLGFKKGNGWGTHAGTQRFAALVAAAEREACAAIAADAFYGNAGELNHVIAAAIRARGAA